MPRRILFVCEVNTGRSPMAAALFAALCAQRGLHDVEVDCAGLTAREGEPIPPPSCRPWPRRGPAVAPEEQAPDPKLALTAELIVTMTPEHRERLVELMPRLRLKAVMLTAFVGDRDHGIPDPFGAASRPTAPASARCAPPWKPSPTKWPPRADAAPVGALWAALRGLGSRPGRSLRLKPPGQAAV